MNSKFTQQEIARLFSILQNQVVLPNGKLNKAFHLMRSDDENNIIHTQTGYCIGYWGYYQTQGIAECERGLNVVHQYSYIKNTTFCNVYLNGKFQWLQSEYKGKPFNAKV